MLVLLDIANVLTTVAARDNAALMLMVLPCDLFIVGDRVKPLDVARP